MPKIHIRLVQILRIRNLLVERVSARQQNVVLFHQIVQLRSAFRVEIFPAAHGEKLFSNFRQVKLCKNAILCGKRHEKLF